MHHHNFNFIFQHYRRIQQQYDQLDREYRLAAVGALRKNSQNGRASRSQPAIGLKQTSKSRPTIFGTLASEQSPKENQMHQSLPQTPKNNKFNSYSNYDSCCYDQVDGFDKNIMDESNTLVYRDGNLISGSLEALTRHAVPTADYFPDRTYLFAFLLSSRLFTKPHELLPRVHNICVQQQNLSLEIVRRDQLQRFCPNLLQLLSEWTETFPYDFRDERLMRHLKKITHRCVQIDNRLKKEVSQMMQNLLNKLNKLEKYEEALSNVNVAAANRLMNIVSVTDITEVCPSPGILAQQLTHIELERISNIGPEEFVQAFAKENPNVETSFRDMKKTRNLESYVQFFNRMSYFVATEICMHLKKRHRIKAVEYFIEVARECFNLGNFNSLMAIIAGLNMSPISRLKKTWAKVNTAKFDILEHQMDPTSNFASYRSTLKAAMWRSQGAIDDREKIVIPFFSLLVKDLYFLNEGCANKLSNGHINFEKFWQLAKQVTEFITWQQVSCPFEKHSKVLNYLLTNPVCSESALALASFECEPPENDVERERCKSLKLELSA
ncbi:hypothetical protein CHUAL_012636 [Chamberlinius hualienensis]